MTIPNSVAETDLPPNVVIGFLPPEDGTGRGMGHVSYTILAKSGLPTGTQIRNVADVLFDQGQVIATNQRDPHNPGAGIDPASECLNTIDAGAPTSHVLPLPAITNLTSFLVQWTGQDDTNGSGVASYDLYVSDNGGLWTQWLTRSTNTLAIFTGQPSHTYGFHSLACDNTGQMESAKGSADAQTSIVPTLKLSIDYVDDQLTIRFATEAGRLYRLEFRNDLSTGTWEPVLGYDSVSGTGSLLTVVQPTNAASSRLYRLVQLQ